MQAAISGGHPAISPGGWVAHLGVSYRSDSTWAWVCLPPLPFPAALDACLLFLPGNYRPPFVGGGFPPFHACLPACHHTDMIPLPAWRFPGLLCRYSPPGGLGSFLGPACLGSCLQALPLPNWGGGLGGLAF